MSADKRASEIAHVIRMLVEHGYSPGKVERATRWLVKAALTAAERVANERLREELSWQAEDLDAN